MGHGHAHGVGGAAAVTAGARHRRPLLIAFAITAVYMVVQFVVALASGSLALLSDAAHMGTDVLGLGMALAAITLAARPTTGGRTYGFYRLEVLAALANGVLLIAVAGYVVVEAIRRFADPQPVPGLPLLIVAAVGLVVNLVSFRLLTAGAKESINLRGAYLEVMADLLGSIGVIVAAVVILTTGWEYADPIVGVAIGVFILPRTFRLIAQALRILLEVAPPGTDVDLVRSRICAVPGVVGVHDLHVWTITSGMESATGHVVVEDGADYHAVLDAVVDLLGRDFGVSHTTIQCEPIGHDESARAICDHQPAAPERGER
jgi:cobalt-zinc-cadmium efflux system protein